MLETAAGRAPHRLRLHEHLLLAARRRRAVRRRRATAAGDDPEFNVRGFECLGACDIAPMASVNGVYVGPLGLDEVAAAATRDGRVRRGEAAAARQRQLATRGPGRPRRAAAS